MKRQAIRELNSSNDHKAPRYQVNITTLGWEKVVKESWKLLMCKLGQPSSCQWRYYAESATDESPSAPTGQRLLCTRGVAAYKGLCWGVVCCPTRWNISPPRQQQDIAQQWARGRVVGQDKEEVLIFPILSRWTIQRSSSWATISVQLLFQGLRVHNDGGLGG